MSSLRLYKDNEIVKFEAEPGQTLMTRPAPNGLVRIASLYTVYPITYTVSLMEKPEQFFRCLETELSPVEDTSTENRKFKVGDSVRYEVRPEVTDITIYEKGPAFVAAVLEKRPGFFEYEISCPKGVILYCFESELSRIDDSDTETVELPRPGSEIPVSAFTRIVHFCKECQERRQFTSPSKAAGDKNFWLCEYCGESTILSDVQIRVEVSHPNSKSAIECDKHNFEIEIREILLYCALPANESTLVTMISSYVETIEKTEHLSPSQKNEMRKRVVYKLRSALASAILAELP